MWQGDITCIEIDAIVNAAKATLLGGGGIDGAIHKAAGAGLLQECSLIGGCDPGDSRITGGYKLPARHVIHTVGPIGENKGVLEKCYLSVLRKAVKRNIQTLAFCCISTGIFGYPNEPAAHVALETVRKWLEHKQNYTKIKRIIFCVFLKTDLEIYSRLMKNVYFPG
uniref:Macro domain-containing protein n=1 Tax=Arcella intermedia TaxID=1963864 RepID=A0A6B2LM58_9EUKA